MKKLKNGLKGHTSVESAIKDVTLEINFLREFVFSLTVRIWRLISS